MTLVLEHVVSSHPLVLPVVSVSVLQCSQQELHETAVRFLPSTWKKEHVAHFWQAHFT